MLDLHDLDAWRDDRCLFSGLSLSLASGEVMQVSGPNGVGKTTLLQRIAGLGGSLPAGAVRWRGQDVRADERFRRELLFLGHLPGLKAALSVRENLIFLASCRGLKLSAHAGAQALAKVGLAGHDEIPVARLSAGQKRRVALARLFTEPVPLWILDEPFTAIDRDGVAALEGWIADHAGGGGLVLLTTHHALSLRCPLRQLTLVPGDEEVA